MKITIKQLKALIKEQVEESAHLPNVPGEEHVDTELVAALESLIEQHGYHMLKMAMNKIGMKRDWR